MNFNDIKASLENEEGAPQVPDKLAKLKDKSSPIIKVRRRLIRSQIIYLLICLLCFGVVNEDLDGLMRTTAIIAFVLIIAHSATYKIRIFRLLKTTKTIQDQTRNTVHSLIHELEIFIEVYKTSAIGMGLFYVLCFPYMLASFCAGFSEGFNARAYGTSLTEVERLTRAHEASQRVTNNIINLLTETNLAVIIAIILTLSFTVYQFNIYILNKRYGKPLKELKEILASLDE